MHFLLKMNHHYYDVSPTSYNTSTLLYDGVPDEGYDITNLLMSSNLSIQNLFTEITMNEETFRPIDKFNNFTIICDENIDMQLNAIKEERNLVVMNYDTYLDETMYQFIKGLFCTATGFVSVVFSFDKGSTWNSYADNTFIPLNHTVTLKEYHSMNAEEKEQWNLFSKEVFDKGVTSDGIEEVNLNSKIGNPLRLAFVLTAQSFLEQANLKNIHLQYNEFPHLIKVKSNEIEKRLYTNTIQLLPLINSTYMESRVFTKEHFTKDNTDDRVVLDTPELKVDFQDNLVSLSWNSIENADFYKVYINGIASIVTAHAFDYALKSKGIYIFSVRAYSYDSDKFKESDFSNSHCIDTYGYLSTADNNFIKITKSGTKFKFLSKK